MGNWTTRERTRRDVDPSSSYNVREGSTQEIPLVHTCPVLSVCPPDPTHTITSTANNKSLLVYEWTSHTVKQSLELPNKPATRVIYNNRLQYAYAACRDGNIYGWKWPSDCEVDRCLVTLTDHTLSVTGIATNEDILVSGSRDNTVRVWSLDSHSCVSSLHISRNLVTDMKWITNDANCVVQSSEDKSLRIWDIRTCTVTNRLLDKQHIQLSCGVSDCGKYIASGSSGTGSKISLWDRRGIGDEGTDGLVAEFKGHTSSVNSCMFLSSDNTEMIISCSNDGTVKAWNRDNGACLLTKYVPSAGPITDLAAPTTSLIASSTFNKGVKIWGLSKSREDDFVLDLRANY